MRDEDRETFVSQQSILRQPGGEMKVGNVVSHVGFDFILPDESYVREGGAH